MKSEWVFAIEESKLPDNGMTAVYPKIFSVYRHADVAYEDMRD